MNTSIPDTPKPLDDIRKILNKQATHFAERLCRSVRKQYDDDVTESDIEYEIEQQKSTMRYIEYLQELRAAIEKATVDHPIEVACEMSDGTTTTTTVSKQSDGQVLIVEA